MSDAKMASSSTLLSQINSDFLTCLICMDTFKKPKVLTCQHSFCQACLESCELSESGSYMSCPVCRQKTLLGLKGVSGLKDNFVFSNMIEMLDSWNKAKSPRHRSTESLQDGEPMCSTCPTTEQTMSTFQCLDCLDLFCGDCAAFHTRTKLTKGHEVVPLEEIENGKHQEKIRLFENSRCKNHEIQMTHYCEDCDVPICKDCIIENHQSHTLSSIEKAQQSKRKKVMKVKSELESSIKQLEDRMISLGETKKTYKESFEATRQTINNRVENLIEEIKKKQRCLNEEVDKVEKSNIEKLEGCHTNLETQLKCMENCVQFSSHLLEDDTPYEIITMHQRMTDTVSELDSKTEEVLTQNDDILNSLQVIDFKVADPTEMDKIIGSIQTVKENGEDEDIFDETNAQSKEDSTQQKESKIKAKPTPAPRRHTAPESENKQIMPKIVANRPVSPLISELKQQHENFSYQTTPRTKFRFPKPEPIRRPRSNIELHGSTESLSPARVAPSPPPSPSPSLGHVSANRQPKKAKAPRPPLKKPSSEPPPPPPPQSKKPLLQKGNVYPLRSELLIKFGKKGKILTNGEFSGVPKCAKFTKNKKRILVLDADTKHILVFRMEGVFKKSFKVTIPEQSSYTGKEKLGNLKPIDIAEADTHHILVLYKTFITMWSWDGQMKHMWGSNDLLDANCIITDSNGRILVSDQEKHMIFVYDPDTLVKVLQFGGFGDRDDLFKSPRFICTNSYDGIIVSDHHNNCVKIYDNRGKFLLKFGERGIQDGQLKYPEGISTVMLDDGSDGILVADEGNCRVSLFTSEGKFLGHALTRADDRGVKSPQFISVSSTGEEMILRQPHDIQLRVYTLIKMGI